MAKPLTAAEFQQSVAEAFSKAVEATSQELIQAAVLAEREACAKIVEDAWMAFTQPTNNKLLLNPFPELRFAAEKIRARGQA
jgi:hypothetical protein